MMILHSGTLVLINNSKQPRILINPDNKDKRKKNKTLGILETLEI